MGQQIVTTCDGCGKQEESEKPHQWLKVDLEVLGIGEKELVYVCSNECLRRFAEKKVNES